MTRLRLADPESSDPAAIAAIYAPWVLDSTVSFELAVPGPDEIARLRGLSPEEFVPGGMLRAYQERERERRSSRAEVTS